MVNMKEFEKVIAEKMNVDEDYMDKVTGQGVEDTKLPPGMFIVHVTCECGTINSIDLSLVDEHSMHCADCDACLDNADFGPEAFEYHPQVM